jgi:hypothetical protein
VVADHVVVGAAQAVQRAQHLAQRALRVLLGLVAVLGRGGV